jgi:hypothetical protein
MNALRETLVTRMIRIYGFEHEEVIEFTRAAEALSEDEDNDRFLQKLVEFHEKHPYTDED